MHEIEHQIDVNRILFVAGMKSLREFEERLEFLIKDIYSGTPNRLYETLLK